MEDILGQGDDDGAHSALQGGGEGAFDHLDGAFRALDLGGPFGQAAEHLAIVDLLEGAAPAVGQGDLADEQDHRGGVLMRRMHADGGMGRAGAAGDHADAGLAGQLAIGLRHIGGAGLVAAGDDLDFVAHIGEGIEDGEIALARDAEDAVDAVHDEGVDDTAGGGVGGLAHEAGVSRSDPGLAMQAGQPAEVHHDGHNERHKGHNGIGDVSGVGVFAGPEVDCGFAALRSTPSASFRESATRDLRGRDHVRLSRPVVSVVTFVVPVVMNPLAGSCQYRTPVR